MPGETVPANGLPTVTAGRPGDPGVRMTAPLELDRNRSCIVDATGRTHAFPDDGGTVVVGQEGDASRAFAVLAVRGESLVIVRGNGKADAFEFPLRGQLTTLLHPWRVEVWSRRERSSRWSPSDGLVTEWVEPRMMESWGTRSAAEATGIGRARRDEWARDGIDVDASVLSAGSGVLADMLAVIEARDLEAGSPAGPRA